MCQVPLDYDAPEGKKASIALVRKPATVKAYSSAYQGPILVNPGGPGASGVSDVLSNGELLSQVVGPGFDIIGFDPRGALCPVSYQIFLTKGLHQVLPDLLLACPSSRLLSSEHCGTRISSAMSSTMIPGIEHWRQCIVGLLLTPSWQKAQEKDIFSLSTQTTPLVTCSPSLRLSGRRRYSTGAFRMELYLEQRLQPCFRSVIHPIWKSIETDLTQDKIERMVLDGNINADDYYRGSWLGNIVDSDKTVQAFYDGCFAAGQTGCPFWKPSAAEIKSGLAKLFERMALNPLPVTLLDGRYGLVDHNLLRDVLAGAAYNPFDLFQLLARGLSDLENGNGTTIFALGAGAKADTACDTPEAQQFDAVREGGVSVNCNDVATAARLEDILTEYEGLLKVSSEWGPMIIVSKASCSYVSLHPPIDQIFNLSKELATVFKALFPWSIQREHEPSNSFRRERCGSHYTPSQVCLYLFFIRKLDSGQKFQCP